MKKILKINNPIPIKKEPKELLGSIGVYESCVFCNRPTDTWHLDTNQPVCRKCSKIHKVEELKKFK